MRSSVWIIAAAGLASAASAAETPVTPGQWEIAVTIKSMEMEGAPPGIAAMMIGRTTRVKQCITAEDAARGPQDMLKSAKTCSFTRYAMAGGRLDSEMVCKQGGSTVTSTTSGSFTQTGFTATSKSVDTGGSMPMTMTSATVGRRIGDCK